MKEKKILLLRGQRALLGVIAVGVTWYIVSLLHLLDARKRRG